MYLYLGQGAVVPQTAVVAVCDMDNTTSSPATRAFLSRAEREGRLRAVFDDLPKSFVICREPGEEQTTVYLSQLSPATLLKRAEGGWLDSLASDN